METNDSTIFRRYLRGGVLIQGSLLWQDGSTNTPWDNTRRKWRVRHLQAPYLPVRAPIRYGRYSAWRRIPVANTYSLQYSTGGRLHGVPTGVVTAWEAGYVEPVMFSGERLENGCYTMVLSTAYDYDPAAPATSTQHLGHAVVGKLLHLVGSPEELHREIKALAKAEGLYKPAKARGKQSRKKKHRAGSGEKYFNQDWGAVSVLINPALDDDLRAALLAVWEPSLQPKEFYKRFCMGTEAPCLNADGTMAIQPLLVGDPAKKVTIFEAEGLDFILATATMPERKPLRVRADTRAEDEELNNRHKRAAYPSLKEVSQLASVDLRRYFQYNYQHHIRTADDQAIISYLLHGRAD